MKNILSIDLETYSSVNLLKAGLYKYAEAGDFEILLCAYAWNDDPVCVVDLTKGEKIPAEVEQAVLGLDDNTICSAFNAAFERVCFSEYYRHQYEATREMMDLTEAEYPLPYDHYTSPKHWRCTAVHSRYLGLPGYLAGVSKVLNLGEKKDFRGKALITYFCKPCKPTKINNGRTRNLPSDAPEKWDIFVGYNKQDVETERALRIKLAKFPVPQSEWDLWYVDQGIVDRGIRIDTQLVENAITLNNINTEKLKLEMSQIAPSIQNPNSVLQLKNWLRKQTGVEYKSLGKDVMPQILADNKKMPIVKRVLKIRREMGKTSVTKYTAMMTCKGDDDRVRGLIMFYGASHSGRWAGRLVQVQNLPQNKMKDLNEARELLKEGEYSFLEMVYAPVPNTLSQLIRTAFIPAEGKRFVVSDFSAIEARVISWLAGEKWRLDVFKTHGKIYEASAAAMFKVPIESISHGSPLRAKGKIAELALGYQGSVGALRAMGGEKMGLSDPEMKDIVSTWRRANTKIVDLWGIVEDAAKHAIVFKEPVQYKGLTFSYTKGILFIKLPSGRSLVYQRATIGANRFNKESILYYGTITGGWGMIETYGGKLTENIIQAIARDCLAVAMMRMDAAGYKIVMHVHDEVIIEATPDQKLADVNAIMAIPIDWAPGLPLKGDGFESRYYKKD